MPAASSAAGLRSLFRLSRVARAARTPPPPRAGCGCSPLRGNADIPENTCRAEPSRPHFARNSLSGQEPYEARGVDGPVTIERPGRGSRAVESVSSQPCRRLLADSADALATGVVPIELAVES